MLTQEEIPLAVEDARSRQQSLVHLILFVDQQAMTLLSVYVAIGTAAAGVSLTGLTRPRSFRAWPRGG